MLPEGSDKYIVTPGAALWAQRPGGPNRSGSLRETTARWIHIWGRHFELEAFKDREKEKNINSFVL